MQVVKAEVSRDDGLRDDLSFLHSHVPHQIVNPLNDSVPSSWSGDAVATYHPHHNQLSWVDGVNGDKAVNVGRKQRNEGQLGQDGIVMSYHIQW